MKLITFLSFLFTTTSFAGDFWEIETKTRVLTSKSKLNLNSFSNKAKAEREMDSLLDMAEQDCVRFGWSYSLNSRKGELYRKKGWKVTSRVSCSKN